MSALDAWRREIRPLIPRGFLRRDQGSGLFISDFPRFGGADETEAALCALGYRVERDGQLARIDGDFQKYQALAASLADGEFVPADTDFPLYALGQRLARHGTPLENQPMEWIRFTMKCLDAGNDEEILRQLPAGTALLQRLHQPLPALAGALILDELFHRRKGAD